MNISPSSLALGLASFRSEVLASLISSGAGEKGDSSWAAVFQRFASDDTETSPLSMLQNNGGVQGLLPTGRNPGLFDPESAYKMMSLINNNDVLYKAQFSELGEMKTYVSQMQEAGQRLGGGLGRYQRRGDYGAAAGFRQPVQRLGSAFYAGSGARWFACRDAGSAGVALRAGSEHQEYLQRRQ